MSFYYKDKKFINEETNQYIIRPAFIISLEDWHLLKLGDANYLEQQQNRIYAEMNTLLIKLDQNILSPAQCVDILNNLLLNRKDTRYQLFLLFRKGLINNENQQKRLE